MRNILSLLAFIGVFALASCSGDSKDDIENSSSSEGVVGGEDSSSSSEDIIGGENSSSSSEDIIGGENSSSSSEDITGGEDSSSSNDSYSSSSHISSSSSSLKVTTIDIPPSGHYQGSLLVRVPAETEDGAVYCEKGGIMPSENSGIKPGNELNLTETSTLRCAMFKNGARVGAPILRTYIIGRLPNLPIVSIAVNPDSMFGSSNGIYNSGVEPGMNCGGGWGALPWTENEIPIHVDFFERGASLAWSYPAGIKIHGGCSRMHPKKSVIVSFREEYGQKNLKYPLFPDYPNLTKFKHFMLRNGGNSYGNDYIRDMLMTSLTEGLDLDYQKGRAVVVYYNGQYYGIHNLRERANGDYFETNYNINEDFIDLVNVENNGEEVSRGSDADYQSIVSWLNSITLDDANLKTLEGRIDLNNFTNHFQSRIFYKDADWPGKNMKRWRSSSYNIKWRWFLYDTDHGFGLYGTDHLDRERLTMMQLVTAENGPSWPNPPHSTFMLRKLLGNANYKNAFINRFSLLIATYFKYERVSAKINALMAPIESEISYDQSRWNYPQGGRGLSSITSFANSRPASMHSELRSFFSLGNPVNLTLSVSGNGKILVHDLPLPETSVTFNAYPEIPITIKAVPNGSAKFAGWNDGDSNAERKITVDQAKHLEARFE